MLEFLRENGGTILMLAVVIVAAALAVRSVYKRKKSGCGCGCGDCPSKEICHPVTFSQKKK